MPRLAGIELPGAISQLRLTAAAARSQTWRLPTLSPPVRIASQLAPLPGVVVTFGPNNFPFRFNGIGGADFAAAIATGHPVLAKAHPLHPLTTRLLADLAREEADRAGLPPATVQLLHDIDPADGFRLVADDRVAATAFTGGRPAGLALKAAADAAGKPIYLELSSLNPVIVLEEAGAARGPEIGAEMAGSVLNGMGQFCTCPGLIFTVGRGGQAVIDGLAAAMAAAEVHPMLSERGAASFAAAVDALVEAGATVGRRFPAPAGAGSGPVILQVSGERFRANAGRLQLEAFGPGTVVVACESTQDARACLELLEPSLTGCLYSDHGGADDAAYGQLEPILRRKVGRLINDKVPTGVLIVAAMNHGGPYPTTGHAGFTGVGPPANLRRFAMLQCYDNVPDSRLPPTLQAANPLGLQRFVDGVWTDAAVVWG
jgi:NADP-dependent aldehyde dehydrogenase